VDQRHQAEDEKQDKTEQQPRECKKDEGRATTDGPNDIRTQTRKSVERAAQIITCSCAEDSIQPSRQVLQRQPPADEVIAKRRSRSLPVSVTGENHERNRSLALQGSALSLAPVRAKTLRPTRLPRLLGQLQRRVRRCTFDLGSRVLPLRGYRPEVLGVHFMSVPPGTFIKSRDHRTCSKDL
jgi:hypothetical protein